jgi:hypothetical protein
MPRHHSKFLRRASEMQFLRGHHETSQLLEIHARLPDRDYIIFLYK